MEIYDSNDSDAVKYAAGLYCNIIMHIPVGDFSKKLIYRESSVGVGRNKKAGGD